MNWIAFLWVIDIGLLIWFMSDGLDYSLWMDESSHKTQDRRVLIAGISALLLSATLIGLSVH